MNRINIVGKLSSVLCGAMALLCGCGEKNTVIRDTDRIDRWIYQTMLENYLWSSRMPMLGNTDQSLDPARYFETLRYRYDRNRTLDQDVCGDRFSAVKFKASTRSGGEWLASGDKYDFGFDVRLFSMDNKVASCQVIYVLPGSPAEKAGIRRGDRFDRIDKTTMPMEQSVYFSLMASSRVTLHFNYPEQKEVTLGRGGYADTPVLFDSIYETSPRTGYVVYNHFEAGENDRFIRELDQVFLRFRQAGIGNLILDLRYNGGGELRVARHLASLIARTQWLGGLLLYKENNTCFGNPDGFVSEYFESAGQVGGMNVNVGKICVLTTRNTASASELIIHTLKPYFGSDLHTIGRTTRGKNLGGVEITNERYEWAVHPITSRIYDRNKVSGYEEGIGPDSGDLDEFTSTRNPVIGDFGDARKEILLNRAITLLTGSDFVAPLSAFRSARSADGFTETTSLPERGLVERREVVR